VAETAGQASVYSESRVEAGGSLQFDDGQFSDWVSLLEHRMGLFISPERRSFLASGLRARMRETGCQDYREYYRRLSSKRFQANEWALLVDCLTVHETCFFRHASSMSLVRELVLPEAFAEKHGFHAWSLGCATGEEAYSLAMLADSYCASREEALYFGVTGTDISFPALKNAREGVYLRRRLRDIRGEYQQRYCRPVSDARFEISAGLRMRVCFTQLNLRDLAGAPFTNVDLIFCQNLLIYFDRERRLQVVDNLAGFLRPGGVLVLGPGELLGWKHPNMEKVRYEDTLAYRRTN